MSHCGATWPTARTDSPKTSRPDTERGLCAESETRGGSVRFERKRKQGGKGSYRGRQERGMRQMCEAQGKVRRKDGESGEMLRRRLLGE